MLHIINKSPFEKNSLMSCFACAKEGSAILLIEDGVYGVIANSSIAADIKAAMAKNSIYALSADVNARGIADKVMDGITLIDYNGFVDLTCDHEKLQSWL
ncbi:MAG: sulfurtransferase complex subunit TusB [Gammaproteobacteria bacterium]|jgi:tRNA 2-thiouridine synthesizing protein B|nr:sulfurtransferase complex subunit TusB [Gammaproteobacteria bacterium]